MYQTLPDAPLSEKDLNKIRRGDVSIRASAIRASKDNDLKRLLARINSALMTQIAQANINADFIETMERSFHSNERRIQDIEDNVGGKKLLIDSKVARLLLLDYENFFGSFGPKFKGFMEGKAQDMAAGHIIIERDASYTDVIKFYLSGKQGFGGNRDQRAECLRRINNVVKYAEARFGTTPLTSRDKKYLKEDLSVILNSDVNPHIVKKRRNHAYDSLLELVSRATNK